MIDLRGGGRGGLVFDWNLSATHVRSAAKVSYQPSIKHSPPFECWATKFVLRIRGDRGIVADLQSVICLSYHGNPDMVAKFASAALPSSAANEAARLLSLIIEQIHIIGDDGNAVLVAFTANTELHDTLCGWGADRELDEDDGVAEEDYRANPWTIEA